jgi:RNA polymerase sigma-70 factor (ECF subfamily)
MPAGSVKSENRPFYNHFLVSDWQRRQTQRRGGGCGFVSWDQPEAERRYAIEPASDLTPDRLFERRWAMTVLERVLARLEEECRSNGKVEIFYALKDAL